MSDVVIQAKLRVTRSAARESGLRSAGSLDRIAAMDPKESGVTLGYFAVIPPKSRMACDAGRREDSELRRSLTDRWVNSIDFAALSRPGLAYLRRSSLLISLVDALTACGGIYTYIYI